MIDDDSCVRTALSAHCVTYFPEEEDLLRSIEWNARSLQLPDPLLQRLGRRTRRVAFWTALLLAYHFVLSFL